MQSLRSAHQLAASMVPGCVSIISPCYNVGPFIDRFITSLLDQTYKKLEIILVNDGATDRTGSVLREAVPRLEREGYKVCLIEQGNKGLAGAVNAGLKHFTGEFLTWPDPDDWLTPNSIARRVEMLRSNPDIGLLRTNARLFDEASGVFTGCFLPQDDTPRRLPELFEDLLFTRTFFAPICHMARSACFLETHPTRSIYFSRASSQNLQMLLPILEAYPVLQVAEPLGNYCVREDSRSRAAKTPHDLFQRLAMLLDVTEHTVAGLRSYRPQALEVVRDFYRRRKLLPQSFRAGMRTESEKIINDSSLAPWRRQMAHSLLKMRCNEAFREADALTGRVMLRVMARMFDRLVDLPDTACRWTGATTVQTS